MLTKKKRQEADLKFKYKKTLELGFIGSLLIHLFIFYALPAFDISANETETKKIEI